MVLLGNPVGPIFPNTNIGNAVGPIFPKKPKKRLGNAHSVIKKKGVPYSYVNGKLHGTYKNSKGQYIKWVNGKPTGVHKGYKPPVGKGKPKGQQWGANFYANILNRLNQDKGVLAGLDAEGQENELEYLRSLRETGQLFDQTKLSNLNTNAATGTAFSSRYAKDTSDTANEFNEIFGDLSSKRKLFMANDLAQRNLIKTSYNDYLRGLALQQAQEHANNGKPKGIRIGSPKFPINALNQSFATPENNSFLMTLRKKYGI